MGRVRSRDMEAEEFRRFEDSLPPYYREFLAKDPLGGCGEDIRNALPCDLEELAGLNTFYKKEVSDEVEKQIGSFILIADNAADDGDILAIDPAKPDDRSVYALNLKATPWDPPFTATGKTLGDLVEDLLARDRREKEAERTPTGLQRTKMLYKKYLKFVDRFLNVMPVLFLSGLALCVVSHLLGFGARGLGIVCLLTVYPAIGGWCAFTGFGIAWGLVIGVLERKANALGLVLSGACAVVFLFGGFVFLRMMIRILLRDVFGYTP